MVISENYCNFKVLKIKSLQKIIAMITEDKVTEIFCIADDFCKVFDAQMEKYTIKSNLKRKYHRESTMSKAEIMVIIILFHISTKNMYVCIFDICFPRLCHTIVLWNSRRPLLFLWQSL